MLRQVLKWWRNEPPLSDEEVASLVSQMSPDLTSASNVELFSKYTTEQREYFSLKTGRLVLYIGEEVPLVLKAEEDAALAAAPKGYELSQLQGLNIGCGARTISPLLLSVDIMRQGAFGQASGEHGQLCESAFLALSDELPFKPNSIDFIVALHMLEHVEEPVKVLRHWLELVKPGGGIGIVVPHWRYTWDARHDEAPYGHKWNPSPQLVKRLYDEHLADLCELEALDTYRYKISFDFVLRKPGKFVPFSPPPMAGMKSGKTRFEQGLFLHDE